MLHLDTLVVRMCCLKVTEVLVWYVTMCYNLYNESVLFK